MRVESNRASSAGLNRFSAANAALNNFLQTSAQQKATNGTSGDSQARDSLTLRNSSLFAGASVTSGSISFGKSRQALSQIRSHLENIRSLARDDQGGQLSASKRAANQKQIDDAIGQITQLADIGVNRTTSNAARSTTGSASGGNAGSSFGSSNSNTSRLVNESIITAKPAVLTYAGQSGGLVQDTATFRLTGNLGNVEISVTQGESLADVAARINEQSATTGVVASVSGDNLRFQSAETGRDANVSIELLSSSTLTVSGRNESQLAVFNVDSIQPVENHTISGSIVVASESAELKYLGAAGGTVTDTASFVLTGDLGNAAFTINRGESLTDVAARINQQTNATGVTASVSSDELILNSTAVGSAADIEINVTSLEKAVGVNSNQITSFAVNAIDANSSETLSAEVTASAAVAELVHNGVGGLTTGVGTFELQGANGTATISVSAGESLTAIRDRINSESATTGVVASVDGNELFLHSAASGSDEFVFVKVTSGSFSVSGGSNFDDGKIDYGTDVEVTVNGSNHVGTGNSLSLTTATGSYDFEFVEGFEGVVDSMTFISSSTSDIVNVSPIDNAQISGFQVNSIPLGASDTLSGQVDRAAEQAQLKYAGDAGSVIKDDGTFTLTGNDGSVSISVTADESLSDVADRINAQTNVTGVTATVDGNDLFLNSVAYGSNAQVYVEETAGSFNVSGGTGFNGGKIDYGRDVEARINGTDLVGSGNTLNYSEGAGDYTIQFEPAFEGSFNSITVTSTIGADNLTDGNNVSVSGVNSAQFANFQVDSQVANSVQTISGEVRQLAEQAQLKYAGGKGSVVKDDGTFTLTGNDGSVSFSVSKDESLSDVADRVNAQTNVTGVTATVDGKDLFFNSVTFGSNAQAYVEVTAGEFDVSGGSGFNGGEIDYGKDAIAEFNGVDYTGDGNRISFTDATGSYTVDLEPGFDGQFEPITVRSIDNAFVLAGGNEDGTANGIDARAVINGQNLTGTGNDFTFSDAVGSYSLEVVDAFVGEFDSIDVSYTSGGQFVVTGGNGNGTAVGDDARTTSNRPVVTVSETAETNGNLAKVVAATTVSGRSSPSTSETPLEFSVSVGGRYLSSFALPWIHVSTLGGSSGNLAQLVSGGQNSGLGSKASTALSTIDRALAEVSRVENLLESLSSTVGEESPESTNAQGVPDAPPTSITAQTLTQSSALLSSRAQSVGDVFQHRGDSVLHLLQRLR